MALQTRYRDSWLPGVTRRQPTFSGGLRDWLSNSQWDPEPGMTKKRLTIAVHSTDGFVDACVNDAITLAIAAFESASVHETNHMDPKSCAWQFIRYYYSAYYAANSLMRLCGYACTNLSALDTTTINQQALLYGVGGNTDAKKLVAGQYHIQYQRSRTPTVTLRASSARGGVHIQFWSGFQQFLSSLIADITASPALATEKSAAINELNALMAELQRSGSPQGSWLSEMRNGVNYRFEHGMWFPYDVSSQDWQSMHQTFRNGFDGKISILNMSSSLSDPQRAVRSCSFLLRWLHLAMATIEAVSKGKKRSLITNGVIVFASRI